MTARAAGTQFRRITWPLIWPVTVLVFTIQLILQLKIFDQVYLFAQGGRVDANMVMVLHSQASLSDEQGRPCRRRGGRAVCGDRGPVGVAVPALARPRASDERVRLRRRYRRRRSARGGSPACAISTSPGSSSRSGTLLGAIVWAFPLYWGLVTTFKPEYEIVRPGVAALAASISPSRTTSTSSRRRRSAIGTSIRSSPPAAVTVLVVMMAAGAGYAISQLNFPVRRFFWWMILASFMVPIPALIVNHFILISQLGLINTLAGVVGPQLIAPVTVIIYKQFFDSVPKDFREAAVIDGASEFQLLFRIYLPMNWGVTTALAIITFIGAWNLFLWPFLAVSSEDKMNITVGITQVHDAFGVQYARDLAVAMLAALPVALVYLIFQRRVTQAIMLSAGIKG